MKPCHGSLPYLGSGRSSSPAGSSGALLRSAGAWFRLLGARWGARCGKVADSQAVILRALLSALAALMPGGTALRSDASL